MQVCVNEGSRDEAAGCDSRKVARRLDFGGFVCGLRGRVVCIFLRRTECELGEVWWKGKEVGRTEHSVAHAKLSFREDVFSQVTFVLHAKSAY